MTSDRRGAAERPNQRGSVLIPFLLSVGVIVVVSGTVIESSLLLHARSRLFDGAENSLLAASNRYLIETVDETTLNEFAYQFYEKNMLDPDPGVTYLDYSQIADNKLLIHSKKTVPMLFLPDKELNVTIAASVPQPVGEVGGAVPISVEEPEGGFVIGTEYVIKDGGGAGSTGNYGPLALSGSGASDYEDDLKYGYEGTIKIGDLLTTKPGNVNGPTHDAIEYRLGTASTEDDILLVVITDDDPQGRDEITVKGFAAFKVTEVDHQGAITGEFIKYKTSAEPGSGAANYGVYTKPKLIFY